MITATRKFNFCYGHRLPGYEGKCDQNHGHNSDLEVTIKGPPTYEYLKVRDHLTTEKYPTMVEDFAHIKRIVKLEVIKYLDHKDLTEFFDPHPPTAEVIVAWCWKQLFNAYGSNLIELRLTEGPYSWVTLTNSGKTSAILYNLFGDSR
jgi:6-pyruvoyltetrahydropterin/6-carboxytetrahydropterin synthase